MSLKKCEDNAKTQLDLTFATLLIKTNSTLSLCFSCNLTLTLFYQDFFTLDSIQERDKVAPPLLF